MSKKKNSVGKVELDQCISFLENKLYPNIIQGLTDDMVEVYDVWKTGLPTFNSISGIGGLPKGRLIEIFGSEGVGKSSLALKFIKVVQQAGGVALYLDYEHSFSTRYARINGVSCTKDKFLFSQPECLEDGWDIIDALITNNLVDLIVLDSLASAPTRAEVEGDIGDSQIAVHARAVSHALRKLTSKLGKSNTTLIFINQIRSKIQTMGYGRKETTPGGKSVKFYASMRFRMVRTKGIRRNINIDGLSQKIEVVSEIKVIAAKNKMAPPFKEGYLYLVHGAGVFEKVSVDKVLKELKRRENVK